MLTHLLKFIMPTPSSSDAKTAADLTPKHVVLTAAQLPSGDYKAALSDKSVTCLTLQNCKLGSLTQLLTGYQHLTQLNLARCTLNQEAVTTLIEYLKNNQHLTTLDLTDSELTEEQVAQVTKAIREFNDTLTHVIICHRHHTTETAPSFNGSEISKIVSRLKNSTPDAIQKLLDRNKNKTALATDLKTAQTNLITKSQSAEAKHVEIESKDQKNDSKLSPGNKPASVYPSLEALRSITTPSQKLSQKLRGYLKKYQDYAKDNTWLEYRHVNHDEFYKDYKIEPELSADEKTQLAKMKLRLDQYNSFKSNINKSGFKFKPQSNPDFDLKFYLDVWHAYQINSQPNITVELGPVVLSVAAASNEITLQSSLMYEWRNSNSSELVFSDIAINSHLLQRCIQLLPQKNAPSVIIKRGSCCFDERIDWQNYKITHLEFNSVKTSSLKTLLIAFPNLISLALYGCNLKNEQLMELAPALATHKHLQTLTISRKQFLNFDSFFDPDSFSNLDAFHAAIKANNVLTYIDISEKNVSSSAKSAFRTLCDHNIATANLKPIDGESLEQIYHRLEAGFAKSKALASYGRTGHNQEITSQGENYSRQYKEELKIFFNLCLSQIKYIDCTIINRIINQFDSRERPTYLHTAINHARKILNGEELLALYESLGPFTSDKLPIPYRQAAADYLFGVNSATLKPIMYARQLIDIPTSHINIAEHDKRRDNCTDGLMITDPLHQKWITAWVQQVCYKNLPVDKNVFFAIQKFLQQHINSTSNPDEIRRLYIILCQYYNKNLVLLQDDKTEKEFIATLKIIDLTGFHSASAQTALTPIYRKRIFAVFSTSLIVKDFSNTELNATQQDLKKFRDAALQAETVFELKTALDKYCYNRGLFDRGTGPTRNDLKFYTDDLVFAKPVTAVKNGKPIISPMTYAWPLACSPDFKMSETTSNADRLNKLQNDKISLLKGYTVSQRLVEQHYPLDQKMAPGLCVAYVTKLKQLLGEYLQLDNNKSPRRERFRTLNDMAEIIKNLPTTDQAEAIKNYVTKALEILDISNAVWMCGQLFAPLNIDAAIYQDVIKLFLAKQSVVLSEHALALAKQQLPASNPLLAQCYTQFYHLCHAAKYYEPSTAFIAMSKEINSQQKKSDAKNVDLTNAWDNAYIEMVRYYNANPRSSDEKFDTEIVNKLRAIPASSVHCDGVQEVLTPIFRRRIFAVFKASGCEIPDSVDTNQQYDAADTFLIAANTAKNLSELKTLLDAYQASRDSSYNRAFAKGASRRNLLPLYEELTKLAKPVLLATDTKASSITAAAPAPSAPPLGDSKDVKSQPQPSAPSAKQLKKQPEDFDISAAPAIPLAAPATAVASTVAVSVDVKQNANVVLELTAIEKEIKAIGRPIDLNDELFEDFLDPISRELTVDPVVAADGITYNRKSIQDYFDKNIGQKTFRIAGGEFTSTTLTENATVRGLILKALEKYKAKLAAADKQAIATLASGATASPVVSKPTTQSIAPALSSSSETPKPQKVVLMS